MNYLDLSYHYSLPQNHFACPKYLVSEISREIEYAASTEFYDSLFDYTYSKICNVLDLKYRPVEWASDLNGSNKFITVTKFNINDEFVTFNDEKLKNIDNFLELQLHLLLIDIFGGNFYEDEICGIISDNIFYKMFNSSTFFEFEASMWMSDQKQEISKTFFKSDILSTLYDLDKDILLEMQLFIDKFLSITVKEWHEILDYPDTPRHHKLKVWIVEKLTYSQNEIKKFLN